MATIQFTDFGGIAPGITPARLPDNAATVAHNCRLGSGRLEPIAQPTKDSRRINFEGGLSRIADAKTIYLWDKGVGESEWIAWKGRVSVAPSNLAVDANNRLFVAGETGFTDDAGNKDAPVMLVAKEFGYGKLAMIKSKLPAPNAEVVKPADPQKIIRYTYFFQTWVDEYGYESPVSAPSKEIEYNDGQVVKVEELLITQELERAVKRRIYKVVTGTKDEHIQFVIEQERIGTKFLNLFFNVKDEDAGEVLSQIEAPPATLRDLVWFPGGFYAGVDRSNNRTVCFSDIHLPYSWPLAFQYTVRDDIVGIAVIGNTLAVMTDGSPWLIGGTAPEAMAATSLSSPYACVSADSICTLGNTVYFASHSGICAISEGNPSVQLLTKSWFGREAWQALNPETCKMVAHDSALFFWVTDDNGVSHGYIIDFSNGAIKAVTTHDEAATCVFEDVERGNLCFVRRVQ